MLIMVKITVMVIHVSLVTVLHSQDCFFEALVFCLFVSGMIRVDDKNSKF